MEPAGGRSTRVQNVSDMRDPGKKVGGLWLPSGDTALHENIEHGPKSVLRAQRGKRKSKVGYQTYKLDTAMRYQPIERRRVCLDIGAHVGLWSMWLAELFERVHAFEPLEYRHSHLFWRNVTAGNVELHHYALGDRAGPVEMRILSGKSSNAFVARSALTEQQRAVRPAPNPRTENEHKHEAEVVTVEMRTLDSFAFEAVDFIKIDTEGFELPVIEGAMETIKRCRPHIIIEQSDFDAYYGHESKAAMNLLLKIGMRHVTAHGPDHVLIW